MGTDTILDLRDSIYLIYSYQNGARSGGYAEHSNDSVIKYHSDGRIDTIYHNQNGTKSIHYLSLLYTNE